MFINLSITSKNMNSLKLFLKFFNKSLKFKKFKIVLLQTHFISKKKRKKFTVLKSPHVNKKAGEKFEYFLYR